MFGNQTPSNIVAKWLEHDLFDQTQIKQLIEAAE